MCHQASLSLMGAERVQGTAMGLDPRNGDTKKLLGRFHLFSRQGPTVV